MTWLCRTVWGFRTSSGFRTTWRSSCGLLSEFCKSFGEPGAAYFQFLEIRIGGQQAAHDRFRVARADLQPLLLARHAFDIRPRGNLIGGKCGGTRDALANDEGADFVDGAGGDHAAFAEDGHAVGEGFGFFEIMSRENDGRSVAHELTQCCPHRFAGAHVESDAGLIEEEQLRAPANRHRELHLALLACGEFSVGAKCQRRSFGQLHGLDGSKRKRIITGNKSYMFAHPELGCERHFLHHDPDLAPRLDEEWRPTE